MNSKEIEKSLKSDPVVREIFVGVFPADCIPTEKEYPGAYIVNTQPSSMGGEHWVAFYTVREGVLEAFDSYGSNPGKYSKSIADWMGTDYVIHSNTERQNSDSTVCGQYCMFFTLLRSHGYKYEDIMSILTRHKGVNDKFVHKFVNKYFRLRTNIRDQRFLNELLNNGFK